MGFSLVIFLYAYYAFLIVWGLLSLVSLYHMIKFGFRSFATFASIIVFIAIALLLLSSSFAYISQIDWSLRVSLFGEMTGGNQFFK